MLIPPAHVDHAAREPAEEASHKQAALTKESLQAVLATCDESPRGKRDRALLLSGWASGWRRRLEIAGATLADLRKVGSLGSCGRSHEGCT